MAQFAHHLETLCRDLQIQLVAEEFSEYLLAQSNATDSVARQSAHRAGVPHIFADPDPNERKALPIDDRAGREAEWLRRLEDFGAKRVLFICGDSHVDSFAQCLNAAGHNINVISRNWGEGWQGVE